MERAKNDDPSAVEELRRQNIKVWTHAELQALNTFRRLREATLRSEKVKVYWGSSLRRSFNSPPEMARGVYAQRINDNYTLLRVKYEQDSIEQSWVIHPEDGSPICNVTDWLTAKEDRQNDEKRNKKQRDRLEREAKRRSLGLRSEQHGAWRVTRRVSL